MSTFVSALGPGSGLRDLSLQPFGPLTSVGLKELFLKTTVLLAFASAQRIEHLHAFSVESDCIRFGPGDCSVTLRPRLEYVPKSLSTPFERTETVSPSALATNHRPHRVLDTQTAICPVRALRFYIDRSSSFGNRSSFWVLWWVYEGPRRIETKSVTLDCGRYHGGIYNPRFGNALCTLGAVQ